MSADVTFEESIEQPMLGVYILGKAMEDVESASLILAGVFDTPIKVTTFKKEFDRLPETEAELDCEICERGVNNTKTYFRRIVQNTLNEAERMDKLQTQNEEKKNQEQIARKIRQTNQPHQMGTTAEIAERLGISKKEVRRRKQNGTL